MISIMQIDCLTPSHQMQQLVYFRERERERKVQGSPSPCLVLKTSIFLIVLLFKISIAYSTFIKDLAMLVLKSNICIAYTSFQNMAWTRTNLGLQLNDVHFLSRHIMSLSSHDHHSYLVIPLLQSIKVLEKRIFFLASLSPPSLLWRI